TKDELDSYLQRFERYAVNERWPRDSYALNLASLLTGKALNVYSRLPLALANDYDILKKALLQQYQLTVDDYRKKFYYTKQNADENATQYRTVNKGNVRRAPLQKMPIINTPFQKVSIDLIGPLSPVTERGNRWILTLVDSATRYPEAVALQTTNTVEVAEKLLGIFSRVGFPSQVLCDNGSQFTS
ncbi:hypothetical protein LSAT2_000001, partial [Lamellibrachia satsuma]